MCMYRARMNLPLLFCVLLLSVNRGQCNHLNNTCGGGPDIGNIRLVKPRHTLNDGAVQICNQFMYRNYQQLAWCYLNSTESWNMAAARVACRQLGLPHSAPTVTMITLQPLVQENVVIGPVTCNGTEDQLRDCLRGQYNISLTYSAMVAGLSCSTNSSTENGSTENSSTKNDSTENSSTENSSTENSISTGVLGAITGILVVALVAVVTAWIISCVYTKRTRSHAPKPSTNSAAPILTNPVYGVGPGTQEVTNNTSVGHTYEQIDDAGNRYDIIRNRTDPVTNGEHTYNVLHHPGRSGDSHMTEANTTTPQDYEVPT